jgi:hypothetical protein
VPSPEQFSGGKNFFFRPTNSLWTCFKYFFFLFDDGKNISSGLAMVPTLGKICGKWSLSAVVALVEHAKMS